MANNKQKSFNVNIDEDVAELFDAQIEQRGFTKYRAVQGALRCWLALPSEVQVKLMELKDSDLLSLDQIINDAGIKSRFQSDIEAAFAEFAKRQGIAQPVPGTRQKKRNSKV